ncbi:unnamed protein product [Onchocerca ochengi]|uniref:COMM domain-containing protein n=1 Tax=Onchocerca ochengi TaxID=42157 RepID=A0A182ERQ7_ONCOC|nr:unnamed protein product [Onchocerca ochengi]
MPSPNLSDSASFDVELRCEQSYSTADLLSFVLSNIPKLTFEQKGIQVQIMQTVNKGVGEILLNARGGTVTHKKPVEALDRSLQDLC